MLLPEPPAPASHCENSTVDALGAKPAAQARAFLADLQTALKNNNKQKIAGMIDYPLRVIAPHGPQMIRSRSQFLAQYEKIFDARVKEKVAVQSSECLFGNYQGAMVGDGEVWFAEQTNGEFKLVTVNPVGPR